MTRPPTRADLVRPLSAEEVASLENQYDRIMQLVGCIDGAFVDVDVELAQALADYGAARLRVDQLKNEKATLIERARNLKTLLGRF